jgi:cell division protein FtsQ
VFWPAKKQKSTKRRRRPAREPWRPNPRLVGTLLLGTLLVGGLWGAYRTLSDPQRFPIRSVGVEGELRYLPVAELQAVMAPLVRGGFFTIDVAAVREAVGALPWVDAVSVRRVWPDTVFVVVTEQVPAVQWGEDGLLNVRGELFVPDPETLPQGLPVLEGPAGLEGKVARAYVEMSAVLARAELSIRRLVLDERRAWRVELANGIELDLGRSGQRQRLERFARVYPRVLGEQAETIRRVDLRYTNGFAVLHEVQPGKGG